MFYSLAANSYPIIFNNTCSSWYEIAVTFIAAGARAYFGTVWAVDNLVAREAAKDFYDNVLEHEYLIEAFYEMTQRISSASCRSIYFYWGLHFSKLHRPTQTPDQAVFNALMGSFIELRKEYQSVDDPNAKKHIQRILRFVAYELKTHFSDLNMERFKIEIEKQLSTQDQTNDDEEPEDIRERGVIDLE